MGKRKDHDCSVPLADDGVKFGEGTVTVDLDRIRGLARVGSAVRIVHAGRNLQMIVARAGKGRYVALDHACTHGGLTLAYDHRNKRLTCACWGQAHFALDGSVIQWPDQRPRPLRAYPVERRGNRLRIHVDGLG